MKVKVIAKANLHDMVGLCKQYPALLDAPFELEIDCGNVCFSTVDEFMEFVRLQVNGASA